MGTKTAAGAYGILPCDAIIASLVLRPAFPETPKTNKDVWRVCAAFDESSTTQCARNIITVSDYPAKWLLR